MLKPEKIGSGSSLFLDRDGVINERLRGDYVKQPSEFLFREGVLKALKSLSAIFDRIVIITNQQGVGKGLMTEEDLHSLHTHMLHEIQNAGGRIDRIYTCTDLAESGSNRRKPASGMGMEALLDFPEIDISKSFMVGDSPSDMEFGKAMGLTTIFILTPEYPEKPDNADLAFYSLADFHHYIIQ